MSSASAPTLDVLNIERRSRGTLLESTKPPAQSWVPDEEANECMVCDKGLSRKHHCRQCGFVVCNSCSMHRMAVSATSGKVRVCDRCVVQLVQSGSTLPSIPITTPPSLMVLKAQQTSAASPGSSSAAASPASLTAIQKERIREKIRKEIEMTAIIEGKASTYHDISQVYQQLHKTHEYQQTHAPGIVIEPETYTGVGADVPDWVHLVRPFLPSHNQSKMGRIKVRVVSIDNIMLENAQLTNVSNISSVYNTDPTESSYVENATVSSTVVIGTMFNTTNPVDILIKEPVPDKSQQQSQSQQKEKGRNIRYGKATVEQECLLDVHSLQQSVKTQIVVHKASNIQPAGSGQNQNPVVLEPVSIPLGSLTIPIKDLSPNTKQNLTLPIKMHQPHPPGNLSIPSYLRPITTTASKQCTVTLEVEFVCSKFAYLWSLFEATSNSSVYESNATNIPPLTLHSLLYYTLLTLNAWLPVTTFIGVFPAVVKWQLPLLSLLIITMIVIQTLYPISLVLILLHIWVLRLVLVGLFNDTTSTTPASEQSANSSEKPSSSSASKKDVKDLPNASTGGGIFATITSLDTTSSVSASSLLTLASLSPDTANSTSHNSLRSSAASSSTTTTSSSSSIGQLDRGKVTPTDLQFSELVLEFLDQIIPLTSLGSLSALYHQIYGFYANFIIPFHYVCSWTSPLVSGLVVLVILASLGCTFILPSHYIWIYLGLSVLLYNSTPVRLLRTIITTAIKVR